jgi:hypothetical protein
MAFIFVNAFKSGLDARRSRITAQQGSLSVGKNIHINRGGEVEKRKAFVPFATLPSGQTKGLWATKNGIYVFGSAANPSLPSSVRYQQLTAPGSPNLTEILSADTYNGVPYVVAKFSDGAVHHFYNGARVTDWDTIAPNISDIDTLGQSLAALVSTDAAVDATYDTSTNKIIITASANNTPFTLSASVSNVAGGSANSTTLEITQSPTASLPQIATVELFGGYNPSFDANESWEVIVNNTPYRVTPSASGIGTSARTFRGKVYATVQGTLYFSDVNNPTRWTTTFTNSAGKKEDTFAGFESLSAQTGGAETLVTTAPYQGFLAVFARRSTQIWQVVAGDPSDNLPKQILDNVGSIAPRSAINFGEMDVFFLSDTGVRSLRARDSSNAAVVFDVGTAVDPLVINQMNSLSEAEAMRACGVVEPREGRYMLALGEKIFVYSFFPASSISAWTTYEPGFAVEDWAVYGNQLLCRSGDEVYIYGGTNGAAYDDSLAEVELSWLSADRPGNKKKFKGIDIGCEGSWTISYSTDPTTNSYAKAGSVELSNFNLPNFRIGASGTHIGLKFTSNDPKPARISSAVVHFDYTETPS